MIKATSPIGTEDTRTEDENGNATSTKADPGLNEAQSLLTQGINELGQNEPDRAIEFFKSALMMQIKIQDSPGTIATVGCLTRASMLKENFETAVLFSEITILLCRNIQEKFATQISLKDQMQAFFKLGKQNSGLAVMWQIYKICQEIDDPSLDQLEEYFEGLEKQIGDDEYVKFTSYMQNSAEQIRVEVVSEIRKTHGDDPLLVEIEGMLKGAGIDF